MRKKQERRWQAGSLPETAAFLPFSYVHSLLFLQRGCLCSPLCVIIIINTFEFSIPVSIRILVPDHTADRQGQLIGLRNVSKASEQIDTSKLLENVVYLEMLSRGYEVKVGKLDTQEIDFVCYKGQKKLYIQVAYVLSEDCIAREFGNLEKIDDNYPKYVISSDIVDLSRNGIVHNNIIDFLLDEKDI